jgi:hypothetical protein
VRHFAPDKFTTKYEFEPLRFKLAFKFMHHFAPKFTLKIAYKFTRDFKLATPNFTAKISLISKFDFTQEFMLRITFKFIKKISRKFALG